MKALHARNLDNDEVKVQCLKQDMKYREKETFVEKKQSVKNVVNEHNLMKEKLLPGRNKASQQKSKLKEQSWTNKNIGLAVLKEYK